MALEYFFIHFLHSIIKTDKGFSLKNYDILTQIVKESPEELESFNPIYLGYLKKLSKDFKNNSFTRSFNIHKLEFNPITFPCENEFQLEKDLGDFISKNKVIEKCFNLRTYDREHSTIYGKVDFVYQGDRLRVPCELKINKAEHDLITQIETYIHHFWMLLHYHIWDYVEGITIANNYSDFALKELKKLDVVILKYSIINKEFKLEVL